MATLANIDQKADISIVLCGQAGQGIQTVESLLTRIFKIAGFNVFAAKEYMSRVRGGMNSTQIRVSSRPVCARIDRIDILIPLNKGAVSHLAKNISPETFILGENEFNEDSKGGFINVDFNRIAAEIGNKIYSNIVAVGTISGLFVIEPGIVTNYIKQHFSSKTDDIIQANIKAAEAGLKIGGDMVNSGKINFKIEADIKVKDQILLSGSEAVALGAIAGGCNFISAYPMSPSTGVLTFLAKNAKEFGIIAEQAEDEIAAMNMVIGAWYAGARGLASTSGGGFALMTEGLSLAGMLESPVVIHLAQRPGPATGLPTRTEQADLELALYAGHGEFPRIIFAPGTLKEAFYLTQKAFNLADKFQVPVFVLTDQYLIDSYYNVPLLNLSDVKIEKYIVETKKDYERYMFADNGISARGIPGLGQGFVVVDSDEHDTQGHITENLDLRTRMVDKKLGKLKAYENETLPPELVGPDNYKNLVIGWGSTYNIINEALENMARDDTAFLHFKQVHPLPPATGDYLKKAGKTIIIENNATSQFGKLIKLHTGIDINEKILKYNGLNFTVEEIENALRKIL
jgi:2-oxoglutarate/2-oxoacid ferredoxin oxidoreductase subunit alpha